MNQEPTNQETLEIPPGGIWGALAGESPASYAAFCTYLGLGEDATLQQVANQTGRTLTSLLQLSSRHHWMERATAYRQYYSQKLLAAAARHQTKQTELCRLREQLFRQQMWEAAQVLGQACRQGVQRLVTDPTLQIEPYELARFFDLFHKLGSRANAPTGFTTEGPVPAPPDWIENMQKLYGDSFRMEDHADLYQRELPAPPPTPQPAVTEVAAPKPTEARPAVPKPIEGGIATPIRNESGIVPLKTSNPPVAASNRLFENFSAPQLNEGRPAILKPAESSISPEEVTELPAPTQRAVIVPSGQIDAGQIAPEHSNQDIAGPQQPAGPLASSNPDEGELPIPTESVVAHANPESCEAEPSPSDNDEVEFVAPRLVKSAPLTEPVCEPPTEQGQHSLGVPNLGEGDFPAPANISLDLSPHQQLNSDIITPNLREIGPISPPPTESTP